MMMTAATARARPSPASSAGRRFSRVRDASYARDLFWARPRSGGSPARRVTPKSFARNRNYIPERLAPWVVFCEHLGGLSLSFAEWRRAARSFQGGDIALTLGTPSSAPDIFSDCLTGYDSTTRRLSDRDTRPLLLHRDVRFARRRCEWRSRDAIRTGRGWLPTIGFGVAEISVRPERHCFALGPVSRCRCPGSPKDDDRLVAEPTNDARSVSRRAIRRFPLPTAHPQFSACATEGRSARALHWGQRAFERITNGAEVWGRRAMMGMGITLQSRRSRWP
jgi:hypothetical protein